jgi:hypothetical protein
MPGVCGNGRQGPSRAAATGAAGSTVAVAWPEYGAGLLAGAETRRIVCSTTDQIV